MRISHQDRKERLIRLIPENLEDLWHIERVLCAGDEVEGVSLRSFKASEGAEGEKKKVHVRLLCEKIEFARHSNRLRITGPIKSGSPQEYVQIGSYHTLDVEPGYSISIYKNWMEHHLSRLKKAVEETKRPRLHLLVLDEKKALLATVMGFGVNYAWEIENKSSKREDSKKQVEGERQYFGDILSRLDSLGENAIIVAGPGFAPENFVKFAKEKNAKLAKQFIMEHCSYAERSGVNELMKRGVVSRVAAQERVAQEMQIMDEFKTALAKGSNKITYGLKNTGLAVETGAASKILVLDELLRNKKEVEQIIELAEKNKTPVMIFSHESDGGKELAGFGGLIAFLRFELPV